MKKRNSVILLPVMILLALIPFATHAQGIILQPGTYLKFTGTPYFVIPRMLASDRTGISSPDTGLQVYQTDAPASFYYYSGTGWMYLGTGEGGGGHMIDADGNAYPTVRLATRNGWQKT